MSKQVVALQVIDEYGSLTMPELYEKVGGQTGQSNSQVYGMIYGMKNNGLLEVAPGSGRYELSALGIEYLDKTLAKRGESRELEPEPEPEEEMEEKMQPETGTAAEQAPEALNQIKIGEQARCYEKNELSIRTETLQGRVIMTDEEFKVIYGVLDRMVFMRL